MKSEWWEGAFMWSNGYVVTCVTLNVVKSQTLIIVYLFI